MYGVPVSTLRSSGTSWSLIRAPVVTNPDLVWDYEIPKDGHQDEGVRRWYIARVLTRGRMEDVREVGLHTIYTYLPHLVLPDRIRRFWEWYLNQPDVRMRHGLADSSAAQASPRNRDPPLRDDFFLTGGTALAALYLHHRYSVDLDLFTENPAAVVQVPPIMEGIASRLGLEITFTRTLGPFLEVFVTSPHGDRVEFDFAQDSPYRLELTRFDRELDLLVDNPTDIACNKLSALFDPADQATPPSDP